MRQFNTLTGFLLSKSSSPTTNDTVDFQGFTSIGDGYAAKFQHNGVIGQTASQSPIDLGLATPTLNDADGSQWVLINGAIQEFNDVLFYPSPFGDSGKGLYSYLDSVWVKISDTTFTTTGLINSSASFLSEVNITTTGFTTSGDGGSGSWIQNGVTGQTASQSPAQLGDALLNDASGNQWALVMNRQLFMPKVGLKTGQDNYSILRIAHNVINNAVSFISIAFPPGEFETTASSEYIISVGDCSDFSIVGNATALKITDANVGALLRIERSGKWKVDGLILDSNQVAASGFHGFSITDCSDFTVVNVDIYNSAGYGMGLQGDATASYERCFLDKIRIFSPGSDGIDFKNNSGDNSALTISNIYVLDPGVLNSQKPGIDIRGPAVLNNIIVEFKNAGVSVGGIGVRLRTWLTITEGAQESSLSNFIVRDYGGNGGTQGIVIDDRNCNVGFGSVRGTGSTAVIVGSGTAENITITGVTSESCFQGFYVNETRATLVSCNAINSTSENFRSSATNKTTYVACHATGGTYGFRSASGATNMELAYCSSAGASVNDYSLGSTGKAFMCEGFTATVDLIGDDAQYTSFGSEAGHTAETITGIMRVRDKTTGLVIKLAVVS